MNQETEKAIRKIANFPDTIKRLYIYAFILGLSGVIIIGGFLLLKLMKWS
jgi:hypothetical protein